jgi:FkbM family methyltransferase
VELDLPAGHLLPKYQERYKTYDRFLPFLARQISEPTKYVLDIGANIGDTAVALAQTCPNPIICVEPDPLYFKQLSDNIRALAYSNRVRCIRHHVCCEERHRATVTDGTTARLIDDASGICGTSLDALLENEGVALSEVALLKTDTDGYDGEVILSSRLTILSSHPPIFWENYFNNGEQLRKLRLAYALLAEATYDQVWIFDNFGNLIVGPCGFDVLKSINSYVASQEFHACPRTIYYTDVLATTACWADKASEAVDGFLASLMC